MTREQVKVEIASANKETERLWELARAEAKDVLRSRGLRLNEAPLMFMAERDDRMTGRLMVLRSTQNAYRKEGHDVKMNMQDYSLTLY